jgi:hypothetical protein
VVFDPFDLTDIEVRWQHRATRIRYVPVGNLAAWDTYPSVGLNELLDVPVCKSECRQVLLEERHLFRGQLV